MGKIPDQLSKVPSGQMTVDFKSKMMKRRSSPSGGTTAWGFGLARVKLVDYENFTVTLQVVGGEDNLFEHVPVPIGMPGAGARHISGSMPMVDDHCFIGWTAQESGGGTRTPVIINWVIPGIWPGHDWMTTQPFTPDEFDLTPADDSFTGNAYLRTRHKLRHYRPGNCFSSSAQGADFVLDEGVFLSDRRGDEIRLRDQDQALVVRSLQQFHAMAGIRIYGGMVQRDATFLPTQMFAEPKDWTGPTQFLSGSPVPEWDLPEQLSIPEGFLTPDRALFRAPLSSMVLQDAPGAQVQSSLDPYQFLAQGLFIRSDGFVFDAKATGEGTLQKAVYGGKSIYRLTMPQGAPTFQDQPDNAVLTATAPALTEYRIEVAQTSDGRLPVTEQTEGFDAERLPNASGFSPNTPFIEQVWGNVVGNDPFSELGRLQYAVPLKPVIVNESQQTEPQIAMALGSELKDYAATLFRLRSPLPDPPPATFWSTTMDGRLKAFISGSPSDFSVEAALLGGLRLRVGGLTELAFDGGLSLMTQNGSPSNNNMGLALGSKTGAVHLYAGGETTDGSALPGNGSGADAASLTLEGANNTHLKAAKKVHITSADVTVESTTQSFKSMSTTDIAAGDRLGISSKTLDLTSSGKCSQAFSGPKDQLPTNGPLRETTFATLVPNPEAIVDRYFVMAGSREEEIVAGNHKTTLKVGNFTYSTLAGEWKAEAGTNSVTVGFTSGMNADIKVGDLTLQALAGAATLKGSVSVTVQTAGKATVSGAAGVYLGGPGPKVGGIVCGADLDPLTGAPLSTYAMGSSGHQLTAPS